jgi:hypothetical protein
VRVALRGHAFEIRLEAVDSYGAVVDVAAVSPGEVRRVEFAHPDGIARVNLVGHEICIREVCWSCDGPPRQAPFVRADADTNGTVNLSDAVVILNHLFLGGEPLSCEDAADSNDDGRIDLSDGVAVLRWLFLGAGSPPPPAPSSQGYAELDCGLDPTPDALGCESFPSCRLPEPLYVVDQICEGSSAHSYGCGNLGASLFQSFTCGASNLGAVSLQLRPGGGFPAAGTSTTIRIRSGGPSGKVLASASAFVEANFTSGAPWVWFPLSPPLVTKPGDVLAVEWLSPAPAGTPAGTILTWVGDPNDPYPGGMAYSGCLGSSVPWASQDQYFKTFVSATP